MVHAGSLPAARVDRLINRALSRNLLADWGIVSCRDGVWSRHPCRGASLRRAPCAPMTSLPGSPKTCCSMAGAEDHYVPLAQLGAQIQTPYECSIGCLHACSPAPRALKTTAKKIFWGYPCESFSAGSLTITTGTTG